MKKWNFRSKEVQDVLRTCDPTQIFRLYKQIYGEISRSGIYDLINYNAPTQKVRKQAFNIAYHSTNHNKRCEWEMEELRRSGFFRGNLRQETVKMLLQECQNPSSNYAKRPMMGHTHLYFCSPIFGHSDYNKRRMLPIKGNERFCELVIKYADRYFPNYSAQ